MSLVATVKMVNLGYYGSFSVGMLCGAHFMFGEDSPMMMSYWKSSNITGAGAEATNWGFRLVACVTLPWLAGPALGCPDETYLLQSLLVSFGLGVLCARWIAMGERPRSASSLNYLLLLRTEYC